MTGSYTKSITLTGTLSALANASLGFKGTITAASTNGTAISLIARNGTAIAMVAGAQVVVDGADLAGYQASGNGLVLLLHGKVNPGWVD